MIDVEITRVRRKIRPITVVSLIDIVFVVILFFIVAGHVEKFAIIPVDLPKAESGQLLDEGPVVVLLGRYDEILINDELYNASQVVAVMQDQLKINPDRIITIKADANLDANKLVDFLESVKQAGGRNISLVTQEGQMHVGS